jgi:hypothetical protein
MKILYLKRGMHEAFDQSSGSIARNLIDNNFEIFEELVTIGKTGGKCIRVLFIDKARNKSSYEFAGHERQISLDFFDSGG